jgi:hypothetical protein
LLAFHQQAGQDHRGVDREDGDHGGQVANADEQPDQHDHHRRADGVLDHRA